MVNLSKPYGASVFVIDGSQLADTFAVSGGGKTGLDIALTTEGTSIGAAWSEDGSVHYGALAPGQASPFGDRPEITNSRAAVAALLTVGEQLLVATTPSSGGSAILVTRVPPRP